MGKWEKITETEDERVFCSTIADAMTAQLNGLQQKHVLTVIGAMAVNIFLHLRTEDETAPDPDHVLAEYDKWDAYARSMLTEAIKLTRMQ